MEWKRESDVARNDDGEGSERKEVKSWQGVGEMVRGVENKGDWRRKEWIIENYGNELQHVRDT